MNNNVFSVGEKLKRIAIVILVLIFATSLITIWYILNNLKQQPIKTSGSVIGVFKEVNEILALKINKAEIYEHFDSKGNQKGIFIFRYGIDVYYDLSDSQLIPADDNTLTLVVSYPEIKRNLKKTSNETAKKDVDEYPEIEIFEWKERKFEVNELEVILTDYIEDDINENRSKYIEMSSKNLIEQANNFFKSFGAEISEIKIVDGGQS